MYKCKKCLKTFDVQKRADLSGAIVNEILHLIQSNGGATWNMAKGNLAGQAYYAVAIYPQKEQIVDEADFENLEGYLVENEGLLSNSNNSFGAWVSGGKTYYDIVATVTDKNEAMKLGQQHSQLAIFDLKNLQEIPLQRTASLKEAGQVTRLTSDDGMPFKVFKNPSPNQAEQLWYDAPHHVLRAVGTGEDVYMWDAYYADHYSVMEQMGLLDVHGGEISIYNPKEAREVAKRFTKQPVMAKLAGVYTDREMQKEYDKIYSERWPDDSHPIDGGNEYYDFAEGGSNDYPNPKDEEKEHVYMDQLDDPAKANFPAGLPEYWVTFYDAQPQGSDEGGI